MMVTVLPVEVFSSENRENPETVLKYAWTIRTPVMMIKHLLEDRTLGRMIKGLWAE